MESHHAFQTQRCPPSHDTKTEQFKVTNWPTCEAGLRHRGSVVFWLSVDAISGWYADRRRTPGGQPRYSDLAIETALMASLLVLMGVDLPVPDCHRRCHAASATRTGREVCVLCIDVYYYKG